MSMCFDLKFNSVFTINDKSLLHRSIARCDLNIVAKYLSYLHGILLLKCYKSLIISIECESKKLKRKAENRA